MTMDIAKIGAFDLDKGLVRDNIKMFAWDGIKECNPNCPMIDECTYLHKGKCAVQIQYVQTLYNSILTTYSYLDEAMLFKIGMELIPLYVHLVKLQIVELSLDTPMESTEKGMPFVHPIYKEIRETLKTIQMIWKGMDMSFTFGEQVRLKRGKKEEDPEKGIDYERGDPNFYKKISKEGPSQKGVVR
jgi:hypothetical protein